MIKQLYNNDVLWQMNPAERMAMFYLFDRMKSKSVAIEVGSYKGGFTKVLSEKFKQVISIDTDHSNIVDKEQYNNVKWITGRSDSYLPTALSNYLDVDFILIDGDHSYLGVYSDINLCLEFTKNNNPLILVHDAAYLYTNLALVDMACKYSATHNFILDFVPGVPFKDHYIGGLALIYKT